jgi:hypothetical protein
MQVVAGYSRWLVPEHDWQNSICGEYLVPHQPWAGDVPKTFEALQIK